MILHNQTTYDSERIAAESELRQEYADAREGVAPDVKLPRFLYAPRREPRPGMIDRHFYEWIDSLTGVRVERDSMAGFFEWCEGIEESEQRS